MTPAADYLEAPCRIGSLQRHAIRRVRVTPSSDALPFCMWLQLSGFNHRGVGSG
jgi:hypothetical protein